LLSNRAPWLLSFSSSQIDLTSCRGGVNLEASLTMSSSMPIPQRRAAASSNWSYSYSSSTAGSSPSTPSLSSKAKQKSPMSASPASECISPRRPSLLGNSLSKSEYTVVNLAHSDGPPRLVTCVKSSQGFDWNQELFLPSYAADFDSRDLEHRPDPVEDIILTDEEAAAMMPQ